MKKTLLLLILATVYATGSGQDTPQLNADNKGSLSLNADFVSRYVWRGLLYSAAPNIQPTLDFTKGNFSVGAWGSYGVGVPYAEIDLYLSYSISAFTFTINNYYVEDETDLELNSYFNWNKGATPHSLEGSATFNGTDRFPISITAATFFFGNDWDENGNSNYSTYFEVGHTRQLGNFELNLFAGGTPAKGLYASKAAIVNLGVGVSHELSLSSTFKLPVFASLVVNPSAQDIFFVFGFTL
jgi:hypothetical protein